jgi:hypothetical protein
MTAADEEWLGMLLVRMQGLVAGRRQVTYSEAIRVAIRVAATGESFDECVAP